VTGGGTKVSEIGDEYVRSLREDHAKFSRVLSMIGRDARRLIKEPEAVLPAFEEAVDYIVNFQNIYHHPREEVMFEKLAEADRSLRQLVKKLSGEHGAVGRVGESIQTLLKHASSKTTSKESRLRLAEKLERFSKEMRSHIRQEEELLYSRVWDEFDDSDWEELAASVPPTDPLGRSQSRRYPLLADYVGGGGGRSEVSMASISLLEKVEARLDRALSKSPRLRSMKSIARRHGEEAAAIHRRSLEALPDQPLLSPLDSARVGVVSVFNFCGAYGRWIKDWHRYVWYDEEPHTDK
jgi:hemerythrin-like domain-containing protein